MNPDSHRIIPDVLTGGSNPTGLANPRGHHSEIIEMKDALLFLIVTLGIIFVVRLLHFLLRRFGFYDWLATWLWNTSKKDGDVFWRMSEWMSNHGLFWEKPAAPAPAPAGTRTDRPRNPATSKIVWALLAVSLLGNVVIVMFFWGVFSQQKEESYSLHRRIETLEQRVPENATKTSMLAEPVEGYNLTDRLNLDFAKISRRLAAIEEEPVLQLTDDEVDFLRGNDLTLERMIALASLTDSDQDGVSDARDEWPTVPRGQFVVEVAEVNDVTVEWMEFGVPMADGDGDGIRDAVDACPAEAGTDYDLRTIGGIPQKGETLSKSIPVAFYGCPDGDGDGIPDSVDLCPNYGGDSSDVNFDGCPDENQDFSQGGVVDHRYLTETPAYGDSSGKLVGRFTAERTVGVVVVEFLIACEAMGADGAQLKSDAERSLVKSWGACRPAAR